MVNKIVRDSDQHYIISWFDIVLKIMGSIEIHTTNNQNFLYHQFLNHQDQ